MCVSPYIATDKAGNLVPVPCGHCIECLEQWSKDWRFRLNAEWRNSFYCGYLTLTYDDNHLPVAYNDDAGEWQSYLVKSDLQKYFKRLRKNCKGLKFRYFAVGEYGGQYNRCHFHVLLFFENTCGLTFKQLKNYLFYNWGKGFIKFKTTESRHIKYCSAYFNKLDTSSHIVKPFKCMSKKFGLCFLTNKMLDYFFREFKASMRNPFGKGFVKLPRYYRKKLDEFTPMLQPDNEGYVWSDIVKMRHYEPKGLDVYFDYFVKNYNDIFQHYFHEQLNLLRTQGISMDSRIMNPNYIFGCWKKEIPQLVDALALNYKSLDDVKVHHKYTKLNEDLILYG